MDNFFHFLHIILQYQSNSLSFMTQRVSNSFLCKCKLWPWTRLISFICLSFSIAAHSINKHTKICAVSWNDLYTAYEVASRTIWCWNETFIPDRCWGLQFLNSISRLSVQNKTLNQFKLSRIFASNRSKLTLIWVCLGIVILADISRIIANKILSGTGLTQNLWSVCYILHVEVH